MSFPCKNRGRKTKKCGCGGTADALVSGSSVERRVGSNPVTCTNQKGRTLAVCPFLICKGMEMQNPLPRHTAFIRLRKADAEGDVCLLANSMRSPLSHFASAKSTSCRPHQNKKAPLRCFFVLTRVMWCESATEAIKDKNQ